MNDISFTVDGAPIPWARAGHHGKRHFTPAHVRRYQDWVKLCARQAMAGRNPLKGAISLHAEFILPVPSSWPLWKQDAAIDGFVRPTSKPDADNLVKAVKDACNSIVWKDDAQVVVETVTKVYGERPRVYVMISELKTITSAAEWKAMQAEAA